jgi:sulfite reductase beta subunit-like hemoprotein
MIADVALHWMLDMSGAIGFACIVRGCQNTTHSHSRAVKWLASHVWVAQSILAVIVAYATVRVVG